MNETYSLFQLSNYNIICLPMICFQRHDQHYIVRITVQRLNCRELPSEVLLNRDFKVACKRTQQLPTLLANNVASCGVRLHAATSLTGLKLWATIPTTRNNMKQGVQTDATCNIQQCCFRLHGA